MTVNFDSRQALNMLSYVICKTTTVLSIVVLQNILRGAIGQTKTRKWFTHLSNLPNSPSYSKLLKQTPTTILPNMCFKRLMSDNHAKLWPLEKFVSVALLGVIPATFVVPNLILDDIFAVLACLHMHWGLGGVIADYVRPIIFGATIPKITMMFLYLVTLSTLASLIYYNHNDIGIGCTMRRLWEISSEDM